MLNKVSPAFWLEADWPAPVHVRAGITIRSGGDSLGPYESFNLGEHVGDDPQAVQSNRSRLCRCLDLPSEPLWLDQEHGARQYDPARPDDRRADSSRTESCGTVCAILTADCVPVLLCNRDGTEIAAAHAGWRGICAGVVGTAVARFRQRRPGIMAWLGPHIGPAPYVVGPEVRAACMATVPDAEAAFTPSGTGGWHADLGRLVRAALAECGVSDCFDSALCNFAHAELFYSYRRDGRTGRMASLIWMEPAVSGS